MPLTAGSALGAYEIVAQLGAGGMGDVWRARDTKLGREVALKVLPDAFALDPERTARFDREARLLASLSHPHIAALYGFEEAADRHFLVMELVEGETIADRLRRGPIGVDEALKIAHQIADALEAAHEKGIVHRDLKPANVKIAPDERVKVLDFGLARLQDEPGGATRSNVTYSPTLSLLATQAGVILGTAAYMSPEQAKGMVADHRSDVFSFGAVLYEMLTGRQAFNADTAPEMMAAVLMREPDWNALPPNLSQRVTDMLRRCLEKTPRRRWQAAGDLRAEIEAILAAPPSTVLAALPKPLWRRVAPIALTAIFSGLVVGGTVWWAVKSFQKPPGVVRFSVPLEEGQPSLVSAFRQLTISPDGTQIVYVGNGQLYRRALADGTPRPIAGTEQSNPSEPVVSPDSQSVAFVATTDRALKKVPIAGGTAVVICRIVDPRLSLSWDRDTLVFSQPDGIMRVPSSGGKPEAIVRLKPGERVHGPHMLPDRQTVLFTLATGTTRNGWDDAEIVAQSLTTGTRRTILQGANDARYLPTGHLLFAVRGVLLAKPFNPARLELTGDAVPIVEGVRRAPGGSSGAAQIAVSNTGSMVYLPGPTGGSASETTLSTIDENGAIESLNLAPGQYESPRISPDGKRLAFGSEDGRQSSIFVYDLDGSSAVRRLTFGGNNRFPVWSRDSRHIAFQSDREGDTAVFWQPADISGSAAERLTKPEPGAVHIPESWSRKDDVLAFSVVKDGTATLWMFSAGDKKATRFSDVRSPAPLNSEFSPDGKWLAYTLRADAIAVYVESFPAGAKYQISKPDQLSHHPSWSLDGKTLFYVPGALALVGVSVTTQPTFSIGNPRPMKLPNINPVGAPRNYDITPDGKRFLFISTPQGAPAAPQIEVVVNWFEELKARVPLAR